MQPEINPAVGIDLGTTNTVVAVQTDPMGSKILEIPQPRDDNERKGISRNEAARVYKIVGKYLGENTNIEALRRDRLTARSA